MKIIYAEWNSFCNEDMFAVLERLGHEVKKLLFVDGVTETEDIRRSITKITAQFSVDILFSFNYFPVISNACNELDIPYVSWVYDSPYINIYSYTVINPCNYIFIFDRYQYEELKKENINTVFHLPMAVNADRLSKLSENYLMRQKHQCEVSFVGSLYTEKKHRLYDKFQNMNSFCKGYLDGVLEAQMKVYGYNFIQEMLTPEIVEEMQRCYPTNPNSQTVVTPEYIYGDYVLSRQVTALERKRVLEMVSGFCKVHLYTYDPDVNISNVVNKGPVDYYNEMPYVFKYSPINLNITLRSIRTGIPLRAMDIMGSGGFLLSNYQEEFLEYFESDKDFVFYESFEDMKDKVKFYLANDNARNTIAKSGCEKVRTFHTMEQRVQSMLEVIKL